MLQALHAPLRNSGLACGMFGICYSISVAECIMIRLFTPWLTEVLGCNAGCSLAGAIC